MNKHILSFWCYEQIDAFFLFYVCSLHDWRGSVWIYAHFYTTLTPTDSSYLLYMISVNIEHVVCLKTSHVREVTL